MVYIYDPKQGRMTTLFNLRSYWFTVVPKVLASLEFWIFMLMHLIIFIAFQTGYLKGEVGQRSNHEMDLAWTDVKVVSAMTTFFEVFYANNCYARYQRFHNMMRSVINETESYAFDLRAHIGEKCRNHVRLSTRYMVAGIIFHLYEIKGKVSNGDMAYLESLHILKSSEIQALRAMNPEHRPLVILNWSAVTACLGCKEAGAPPPLQGGLTGRILNIHAYQQDMVDLLALPIPFAYYHLLSVMIIVNLGLWGYRMALTASLFAPVVFFFAAVIFIGVMELSSEMADPFGSDEVDFPLDRWISELVSMVIEVTEYRYMGGMQGLERAVHEEVPLPRGLHDFKILASEVRQAGSGDGPPRGDARDLAAQPLTENGYSPVESSWNRSNTMP